jgi:methionyl-tRNA synthetase
MKFITTTLPYSNSRPHMGHGFEFILADAIVRYNKSIEPTFFNIGLDEHGLKIQTTAEKENIPVQTYVENLRPVWNKFINVLNICPDKIYYTASSDHHTRVQAVWNTLFNQNDIYKKKYIGKYCIGCESFKTDKDLVNGICLDHPNLTCSEVEEENYFFRLSKYKPNLLEWINKDFTIKLNETINLIEQIEDISISRNSNVVNWGVPVPNDPTQTIYVWFDALLNYIFSAGYNNEPDWKWSALQICGPDNLRFQAVIFQGILAALNINQTTKLIVHGTILDDKGNKMSKSLGNVIDPIEQVNLYGTDPVRYYALAGLSTYSNSNWNTDQLIGLYNKHLCDDWGNLITRVLHLIELYKIEITDSKLDLDINLVELAWSNYDLNQVCININKIVKHGNNYITLKEPWKIKDRTELTEVLSQLYNLLVEVNGLYYPIIPESSDLVKQALIEKKKCILFVKL